MVPPNLISFVANTWTKEAKGVTAVILRGVELRGVDSAPEASRQFLPRSTTALYFAVPWPEIQKMDSILPARVFFEAARRAGRSPHTGFEEGTTISVD